jgi:hypothetical protein
VIYLDTYRQKRAPENANVSPEILDDAEEAIQEIAKHLLQAIRIVTARHRHRQQ